MAPDLGQDAQPAGDGKTPNGGTCGARVPVPHSSQTVLRPTMRLKMKHAIVRVFAVAAMALLIVASLASAATASESRTGYRECARYVYVNSTTSALNSSYYVYHRILNAGYYYYSPRKYTPGYYVTYFNVRGGTWYAHTSNGRMSSAGAGCW